MSKNNTEDNLNRLKQQVFLKNVQGLNYFIFNWIHALRNGEEIFMINII